MFIDFSDGVEVTKMPVGNNVYFSPSQEYSAATTWNISVRVHIATANDSTNFIYEDDTITYKEVRWLPQSRWLLFINKDAQLAFFDPMTLKKHVPLPGGIETGFFKGAPKWGSFSSDGRWLVVPNGSRKLYAIPLEGKEPEAALAIVSRELAYQSTFAPSGKLLAYYEVAADTTSETQAQLQLVDMSGKRPQVLRQVSSVRSSLNFEFSSDSVALAYTTDDGVNLHVVDLLEKNSVGAEATNLCSRSGDCEDKVASFVFQP